MSTSIEQGQARIEWAVAHMPLLNRIRKDFLADKPFAGKKIAMSIHLEAKTACLAILLRDGGAEVAVTGSNPLSTQDIIAEALAEYDGVSVHARHGVDEAEYTQHLRETIAFGPDMILDDGGDLLQILMDDPQDQVIGGCEETTTGVARLRILAREGRLPFPMFAVNDARLKFLFDNRYGTGQSTWDAILRSTNLLIAGKDVVVVGYGWCGRGIALRAQGLGARVTVCDVDPVRALEARMDGFGVSTVADALKTADFVITATGCADAVSEEALATAKDGVLLSNAGHFNVEVRPETLEKLSTSIREARPGIVEYTMPDGRRLYLMGEGRLVNLVLGDGHPVEIMDLSFAVQALTLRYLLENSPLPAELLSVPAAIDDLVARTKLETLGITIDRLTAKQRSYLGIHTE